MKTIPNEEVQADMYDLTMERLSEFGLHRYEVSNFSTDLPTQCKHNKGYWNGNDYIGLGPGAHSRFQPLKHSKLSQEIAAYSMRGKTHNVPEACEKVREARIQTLEPEAWMREVEVVGHGTRKIDHLSPINVLSELFATTLRTDVGLTRDIWCTKLDDISSQLKVGYGESIRALTLKNVIECDPKCQKFITNGTLIVIDDNTMRMSSDGLKYLDHVLPYLLNNLSVCIKNLFGNK